MFMILMEGYDEQAIRWLGMIEEYMVGEIKKPKGERYGGGRFIMMGYEEWFGGKGKKRNLMSRLQRKLMEKKQMNVLRKRMKIDLAKHDHNTELT